MLYRLFIDIRSFLSFFLESIEPQAKLVTQITGRSLDEVKSFLLKFTTLSKIIREKIPEEDLFSLFFYYSGKDFSGELPPPRFLLDISRYISKKEVKWELLQKIFQFLEKCNSFLKNISTYKENDTKKFDEPELVYEDNEKDVKVYHLPSKKAASKFCSYGKWCITDIRTNYFLNYRSGKQRGYPVSFYIVIHEDKGYIVEVPDPKSSDTRYFFSDYTNNPSPYKWEGIVNKLPVLNGLQHLFKFRPITNEEKLFLFSENEKIDIDLETFLNFDKESLDKYLQITFNSDKDFKEIPSYVFLLLPLDHKRQFIFDYIDLRDPEIFKKCNRKPGESFSQLAKTRIAAAKKLFFKKPYIFLTLVSSSSEKESVIKNVFSYFTKHGFERYEPDSLLSLEDMMDSKEIEFFLNEQVDQDQAISNYLMVLSSVLFLLHSDYAEKKFSDEEIFRKLIELSSPFLRRLNMSSECLEALFIHYVSQFLKFDVNYNFQSLSGEAINEMIRFAPQMSKELFSKYNLVEKVLDYADPFELVKNKFIYLSDIKKFFEKIKNSNVSNEKIKSYIKEISNKNNVYYKGILFGFYYYDVIDLTRIPLNEFLDLFLSLVERNYKTKEIPFIDDFIDKIISAFFSRGEKDFNNLRDYFFSYFILSSNIKESVKKTFLKKISKNLDFLYKIFSPLFSEYKNNLENKLKSIFENCPITFSVLHKAFINKPERSELEELFCEIIDKEGLQAFRIFRIDSKELIYILDNFELKKSTREISDESKCKKDIVFLLLIDIYEFNNEARNKLFNRMKKLISFDPSNIKNVNQTLFSRYPKSFQHFIASNENLLNIMIDSFDFENFYFSITSTVLEHILSFIQSVYETNSSKINDVLNRIDSKISSLSSQKRINRIYSCLLFAIKVYNRLDKNLADFLFNIFYNRHLSYFSSSNEAFLSIFVNTTIDKAVSNVNIQKLLSSFFDFLTDFDKNIITDSKEFFEFIKKIYLFLVNHDNIFNNFHVLSLSLDMYTILSKKRNIDLNYMYNLLKHSFHILTKEEQKDIIEMIRFFKSRIHMFQIRKLDLVDFFDNVYNDFVKKEIEEDEDKI